MLLPFSNISVFDKVCAVIDPLLFGPKNHPLNLSGLPYSLIQKRGLIKSCPFTRKSSDSVDVDQVCLDSMDLRRKIEQESQKRDHCEVLLELNREQARTRQNSGLVRYAQVAKVLQNPSLENTERQDCLRYLTLALLEMLEVKDRALSQQHQWNKSLGTRLRLLNQKRPGLIKDQETPILDLPSNQDVQVDFQQPQTNSKANFSHSFL